MAQHSSDGPERLGNPPDDLRARPLPLVAYSGTARRIHWLTENPRHFGKSRKWRFDDPLGQYGVMYAAHTQEGAFAETLLPRPGVLVPTGTLIAGTVPVSATTLAVHGWADVVCNTPLQCVDLTGVEIASIGADATIATGPWRTSQQWSRALFTHPSEPDALLYRCRRDPSEVALAFHERASPKVAVTAVGGLLEPQNLPLLARAVQRYHVAIIPG